MITFLQKHFEAGGPFMLAIAAIQLFSIFIFLERFFYLYFRCRVNAKGMVGEATKLVKANRLGDARRLCVKTKSPIGAILESALWAFEQGYGEREIQNAIDETALRELPKVQKRVHYLSMAANVATLLGLLGTITGLMKSFGALAAADPAQKATLLAKGISEFMEATAYGLITAIPCLVAFSILGAKVTSIVEEVDESSVRLLNMLSVIRDTSAKTTAPAAK
jgi:biopolymer transport protein ExbB/TolQ